MFVSRFAIEISFDFSILKLDIDVLEGNSSMAGCNFGLNPLGMSLA